MPRIIVQAIEGRTLEQKRTLVSKVTDAVVDAFGVEPTAVTVVIQDIPKTNFGHAGVLSSDREATTLPS